MTCPYCQRDAEIVTGARLYPHRPDLVTKLFWRCDECDAHVGCHQDDPARPLGRMANERLRRLKSRAHAAFDPLWKARHWKRGAAYRWLAEAIGIKPEDCHIGMFDEAQCLLVIDACTREAAHV